MCALWVGIEDCQECGDDVPLIRGYIIEDNGRIGRVEREQAYAWIGRLRLTPECCS